MKNRIFFFGTLCLFAALSCDNNSSHKDHALANSGADTTDHFDSTRQDATVTAEAPPDSAAIAKAWENYMKPGPMHQLMATWNGKWDAEIKTASAPGGPLSHSDKVTAEFTTILNGLYQESKYKGKMMGMPFEGQGITGYDNAREKWFMTWIDNMGSGILFLEGDYDKGNRVLTLTGKSTDASSGKLIDFKQVMTMTDDHHQLLEMFATVDGKEKRVLEIHLTKKGSGH